MINYETAERIVINYDLLRSTELAMLHLVIMLTRNWQVAADARVALVNLVGEADAQAIITQAMRWLD